MYDQFVLNLEFNSRSPYNTLDSKWNVHNLGCSPFCKAYAPEEAYILHWSGRGKPWYNYDQVYRQRHQCLKVFQEYVPDSRCRQAPSLKPPLQNFPKT